VPGQFFGLHLRPGVCLADVVVLAELAFQIAAGEKDGARAAPAAQNILLPHEPAGVPPEQPDDAFAVIRPEPVPASRIRTSGPSA
jgi:hypothetical protein